MVILAISTSQKESSVSILNNGVVQETLLVEKRTRICEELIEKAEFLIKRGNVNKKDISVVLTDIGPGSFTGIRIGVATAKALSLGLGIKSLGVSALDMLAFSANHQSFSEKFYTLIDAGRKEVYYALYKKDNNFMPRKIGKDSLIKTDEFKNISQGMDCFSINGHSMNLDSRDVDFSSKIMLEMFQVNPEMLAKNSNLTPNYVRVSDAELNYKGAES